MLVNVTPVRVLGCREIYGPDINKILFISNIFKLLFYRKISMCATQRRQAEPIDI